MSRYAFYRMERNAYLDECLALVCKASEEEIRADGLQQAHVVLILKSALPITATTLADLRTKQVFCAQRPPLLRLASECFFGVFGDSHCECEAQRVASLRAIARHGEGVFVHIPQEAQGNGLFYKAQELQLQVSGIAPSGELHGTHSLPEASLYLLGSEDPLDKRGYQTIRRVFCETALNRYSYELITDSPLKTSSATDQIGLDIATLCSLSRPVTVDNAGEYLAKLYSKDHPLSASELEDIYSSLLNAVQLPGRVLNLLASISADLGRGREFPADREALERIANVVNARSAHP